MIGVLSLAAYFSSLSSRAIYWFICILTHRYLVVGVRRVDKLVLQPPGLELKLLPLRDLLTMLRLPDI
jgi:hypothetical protein